MCIFYYLNILTMGHTKQPLNSLMLFIIIDWVCWIIYHASVLWMCVWSRYIIVLSILRSLWFIYHFMPNDAFIQCINQMTVGLHDTWHIRFIRQIHDHCIIYTLWTLLRLRDIFGVIIWFSCTLKSQLVILLWILNRNYGFILTYRVLSQSIVKWTYMTCNIHNVKFKENDYSSPAWMDPEQKHIDESSQTLSWCYTLA